MRGIGAAPAGANKGEGRPLQEYIRRRRLTRAAMELQNSAAKVIDVAVKYGYASPDAFTRAFQNLHGLTPRDARAAKRSLTAYPPMTFRLTIGGSEPMKFRIENKEAFQVIGLYNRVTPIESGEHPGVEQVWRSLDQDTYAKLNSLNDAGPRGILHVNVGEGVRAKDDYDYYLAVASTRPCPDRFKSYTVSAMTWAVFEMTVPWEKEKWHRIYGEWFPSSGYEQIAGPTFQVGPEIEIGLERQVDSGIEHDVELWLPVAKVR